MRTRPIHLQGVSGFAVNVLYRLKNNPYKGPLIKDATKAIEDVIIALRMVTEEKSAGSLCSSKPGEAAGLSPYYRLPPVLSTARAA